MYRHFSALTSRPAPATRNRGAFTLVELLVVITIIALLVGLLIPAIQAARGAARKTQCINNQKNLATAVINYATTKEKFPPLFSWQPGTSGINTRAVGWVPPILPNIEQNELYRVFQNNLWYTIPNAEVETLVCPSRDPSSSPAPLSYVVNAGVQDAVLSGKQMDFQENGVFFDEFTPSPKSVVAMPPAKTPPIDLAYLSSHDGTKNTIMLSENCLNTLDWIAPLGTPSTTPPPKYPSLGMSYWNAITWEQPNGAGGSVQPNWGTDGIAPTGTRLNQPNAGSMYDYEQGRPFSYHSGGFIVAYCDGHCAFMSQDIEYRVYCLLMSPDSNNAKYTFTSGSSNPTGNGNPMVFPAQWRQGGVGPLRPITDADLK